MPNKNNLKTKMKSYTRHNSAPLTLKEEMRISESLFQCIEMDQLAKAKQVMKGLKKEERQRIVSRKLYGNPPLFVAAQQGLTHFVSYFLIDCEADIEQRGVYEGAEDDSENHVTPLWCAAVANQLDVVKLLIHHSADIDATSDTESTPVCSACYMTNIEVVKYLVEKGANIHEPNIRGGTCLINSVQSVDLCRFLIEKNANVNAQDDSGSLALHHAIHEGRIETVRLLLDHGSDPYVKNDYGDDAIRTAVLQGQSDILEFLVCRIKPAIERQIDAYSLLGAYFVDTKHDIQQAIQNWRLAMELRYKNPECVIEKRKAERNPAYQNQLEISSMAELEHIAMNPDAVYMQALIIRERILGPGHSVMVEFLLYRGAVYSNTHNHQRCLDLWKHAFRLRYPHHCRRNRNPFLSPSNAPNSEHGLALENSGEPLSYQRFLTLKGMCSLFWEIYDKNAAGLTTEFVLFDDVYEVRRTVSCTVLPQYHKP